MRVFSSLAARLPLGAVGRPVAQPRRRRARGQRACLLLFLKVRVLEYGGLRPSLPAPRLRPWEYRGARTDKRAMELGASWTPSSCQDQGLGWRLQPWFPCCWISAPTLLYLSLKPKSGILLLKSNRRGTQLLEPGVSALPASWKGLWQQGEEVWRGNISIFLKDDFAM